jgi:tetratricopeptide (TPR) repeat protein
MGEERDWLYESDEVLDSIRRFEDMIKKRAQYFFDVHEFEEIINYYIDTNSFSKAVSAAEYGYRMYPGSTIIQLKIAHLLIDRGKAAESIGILNKIEKIEQSNYEVYILKGSAYNILGKTTEAMRHFDKAVSLSHKDNRDTILYNIGLSFENQNNYESAIHYFEDAYKLDPTNSIILYDLAYCYDHLNKYDKSIYYYNKFIDEDPYSEHAWFNLGTVYNKAQMFDEAIEAYDFAIAINENYSSAYFNKANILSNLERYKDALPEYLEFLKFEDSHVVAHCYIGECYEKLARYEESLFFFQKAVTLDPNCADAWFGKGVVKMHQELYDESLELINKALELNEDNTEYLYAKGLVYMRQSDHKKGIQVFKQVTELDPVDYDAWLNYSELLLVSGNIDKAIEILQKACDYNFNNANINLRLASYMFLQKKMNLGYTYLEKALTIDADCIEELYDFYPEAALDEQVNAIIKAKMNAFK